MMLAASSGSVGMAEALVGLPVAVVIVSLALYLWHLLRTGVVVLGREHEQALEGVEERHDEMREDRDFWRTTALRLLNVSEAVTGRDPSTYSEGR